MKSNKIILISIMTILASSQYQINGSTNQTPNSIPNSGIIAASGLNYGYNVRDRIKQVINGVTYYYQITNLNPWTTIPIDQKSYTDQSNY